MSGTAPLQTSTENLPSSETQWHPRMNNDQEFLLNLLPDLEGLTRRNRSVNLFEIAGLVRQEVKHSNFLGYLLDPAESHGLQDDFLKRLLVLVVKSLNEKSIDNHITTQPLRVMLSDYSDAIVRREWMNLDLFIVSDANQLVFAIENKVGAKEGKDQLSRYRDKISSRSEYAHYQKVFAFLTPEGEEGSDPAWVSITYDDVLVCLLDSMTSRENAIPSDVKIILAHYIELIKRNVLMNDEYLVKECREIYSRHKDAINLIMKYGVTNNFIDATNDFSSRHPELVQYALRTNRAFFVPQAVVDAVPELPGVNWWDQKRPYGFWFGLFDDTKLGIIIEIGPFGESQLDRGTLAKNVLQQLSGKDKKISSTYTRVYTKYVNIEEGSSNEEIYNKMEELFASSKEKLMLGGQEVIRFFDHSNN